MTLPCDAAGKECPLMHLPRPQPHSRPAKETSSPPEGGIKGDLHFLSGHDDDVRRDLSVPGRPRPSQGEENGTARDRLQAELDDCRHHLAALQLTLEEVRASEREWQRRHLVLHSLAHRLLGSFPWKLLAPLRFVRNQLAPRGFD